ncbi:Zinc finger protein RTS2 [Taphrina deformans PYCC 5710]|uniref:Zinc finger protein RTS2 n=1 Tax=Taphrina deformans (strain PYCC 5710 / ATCC 11124 / CBS 356.35 / IMI 108563 / JCM 9778 / NBRC 8474) TaxID=1097556 RepID=R4XC08_TAPDE|nr:Zinc finger protein RTS2 [Taphrina deformans PYCC 5710]|eukprot:CCG83351.1 Zinc finger protein RTS2 [Taphrina deformans PYCC 5710]
MPKAEKGTPKDLANRMKSRGLQKLAFYCQVCEKQMRDQNGFKQHCASEPHVRMMLLVGQNPSQAISDYSRQFKHDFLQLLRTAHGEKRIQANHFYQEYIQNKSHIHMNGTHWKTLSEFVKSLGREGICRVDDGEKGLFISWIDNSPEALNRQAAIKKKDKQDKGDEERANQLIAEQIERANQEAAEREAKLKASGDHFDLIARLPEQKIKIAFGKKKALPVHGTDETTSQGASIDTKGSGVEATPPCSSALPTHSTQLSSANPLSKKPNIFASQKHSKPTRPAGTSSVFSAPKPLSNAQQMILDDQLRVQRQKSRGQVS